MRTGTCLGVIKRLQPRRDASAGYERGPIEHGEARRSRARLSFMQGASSEQVVMSGIDCGHWRIVFRGEPTDVRGVFDAAVDGETNGSIEFIV